VRHSPDPNSSGITASPTLHVHLRIGHNPSMQERREQPMEGQRNVFGEKLQSCSDRPLTGFFRTGCCHTGPEDLGLHTVCVEVTAEFLAFSKARGNDLSTPQPDFGFPGLKPGDRWCLCAARWREALEAASAPRVILSATHEATLEIVALKDLKRYAIDLA
jgi:uncharacterized protein (DUF2237 family)